jgi:hypothetical protein
MRLAMSTYEEGFNAGLEAAAKAADYWGEGHWKFQGNGRKRFDSFDCQNVVNTTSRAIAEDIRKLRLCEDEGCPNHGTPHVCLDRQSVDQAQPQS